MTKVLDAKIQTWGSTYRPHHLQVLLDDLHKDDKIYNVVEHEDGSATYLSVTDGIVSFFFDNPKDHNGFGGSKFTLPMTDGSERVLVGPWSSNNAWIKKVFGLDSMSVSYTADPKTFERGYTFYAGNITTEIAFEAMKFVEDEWRLINAASQADVPKDASGEQAAIIEGALGGWYIARENCPDSYKTEKYLWGLKPNQRWATRATDELDPALCLNGWHRVGFNKNKA